MENTYFNLSIYGDGKRKGEEAFDLLSEIVFEINELYGKMILEGTEENTKRLIEDMVNDGQFKRRGNSNNTESNQWDELHEIYENENIKSLIPDTSTKRYNLFNRKEFKEKMIQ